MILFLFALYLIHRFSLPFMYELAVIKYGDSYECKTTVAGFTGYTRFDPG